MCCLDVRVSRIAASVSRACMRVRACVGVWVCVSVRVCVCVCQGQSILLMEGLCARVRCCSCCAHGAVCYKRRRRDTQPRRCSPWDRIATGRLQRRSRHSRSSTSTTALAKSLHMGPNVSECEDTDNDTANVIVHVCECMRQRTRFPPQRCPLRPLLLSKQTDE